MPVDIYSNAMSEYRIILPNEKAATYGHVTLFILLLNFFLSCFIYLNAIDTRLINLSLIAAVISLLSLLFWVINSYFKKLQQFRIEISFFILAVIWFLIDRHLLSLSIFCFAVIGIYTRRPFVLLFSKQGISYPSFPKKQFPWNEVENVILKDGMLTIDLKNNTLIQKLVDKTSATSINEREFNLFCKHQLHQTISENQDI